MNKSIRNRLLSFALLMLAYSNIANAQDSLKYAIKLTSDFNVNKNLYINKYFPKIIFCPSFMYQTKKQKWREIQLSGIFKNKDIYNSSRPIEILGTDANSSVFLNVITHTNLVKKSNSKLMIFYSFNTRFGYERLIHEPKSNLSYFKKTNVLNLSIGLSSRIGYNLTNRIYLEITPPLSLGHGMIFGKRFLDNPLFAVNLRNQPIFDIESFIAPKIKEFPLNNFSFAVAYRF